MSGDEPVIGVAGEAEVERPISGIGQGSSLDEDVVVFSQALRDPSTGFPQPANFEERLQFQHHERRDSKFGGPEQLPHRLEPFGVAGPKPDRDVGIEVNHRRGFQCETQSK